MQKDAYGGVRRAANESDAGSVGALAGGSQAGQYQKSIEQRDQHLENQILGKTCVFRFLYILNVYQFFPWEIVSKLGTTAKTKERREKTRKTEPPLAILSSGTRGLYYMSVFCFSFFG